MNEPLEIGTWFRLDLDPKGLDLGIIATNKGALFVLSVGVGRIFLHILGIDIIAIVDPKRW